MKYDQERAYEAFKILRELNPTTTPFAFTEYDESEKIWLHVNHDILHNALVVSKAQNMISEAISS